MPNNTKLRLTLDVEYAPNGTPKAYLKDLLAQVVVDALNYGGLTGETAATVEKHSFTVRETE